MRKFNKPRRPAQNFQAEYFASRFKTYDEAIQSYRSGGHVPSHQDFDRAKLNNKKSVTWTE